MAPGDQHAKRIPLCFVAMLLSCLLLLANFMLLEKSAQYTNTVKQLRQEVTQMNDEIDTAIAEMDNQLTGTQGQIRELQNSHELMILVSQDLDERIAKAEGK